MADCLFSLALCTENKSFSTIYYVLVGYENMGTRLSDTGKSMVKMKPEGHPLIIKLLLSLWLLYKNYINYYYDLGMNVLLVWKIYKRCTYDIVCVWAEMCSCIWT